MHRKEHTCAGSHAALPAADAGVYMLLVRVQRAERVVCRRRAWHLRAGWYVYVGSAQRGVRARIARHLRHDKRLHWHIDYLLQTGAVAAVRILPGAPREAEAALARAWCGCGVYANAMALHGTPVPGFGASDSPAPSHLVYFPRRRDIVRQPLWQRAFPYIGRSEMPC